MFEFRLHDDAPDVDASIEDYHCDQTKLCTTTLAQVFEIEDEAETKAANAKPTSLDIRRFAARGPTGLNSHAKEWRYER